MFLLVVNVVLITFRYNDSISAKLLDDHVSVEYRMLAFTHVLSILFLTVMGAYMLLNIKFAGFIDMFLPLLSACCLISECKVPQYVIMEPR